MKHLNKYSAFKETSIKLRNTEFKLLGNIKVSSFNYPLFKIDINKRVAIPSICLSAAIHGNEPSGVTGMLNWLYQNNYNNNINYKLFPIVNPFGYNFSRRTNHNRVNLNREFNKKNPQKEIKLIKKDLHKNQFDIFISFHENNTKEKEDFYIYSYPSKDSIKFSKFILNGISNIAKIDKRKEIDGYSVQNGLIIDDMESSFEFFMGNNSTKSSICVEIPSKISIITRTEIAYYIIQLSEMYLSKTFL